MKVIDCHSHISVGYDDNNAYIKDYIKLMKKYKIYRALIMPQPIMIDNKEVTLELFNKINQLCYDEIYNSGLQDKILFVPMISPVFMDSKSLKVYKNLYKPIAYKIHFRSDKSYPEMISKDFIDEIKEQNIPLIVHTDYSNDTKTIKGKLKKLNSARKWFEFFERNNIRGYLTHGARLNRETLEAVNKSKNVVIGIGPDLLLNDKNYNLLEQDGNYLQILHDNVSVDKLFFDVDFRWNISNNRLDVKAIKRMRKIWNCEEMKKIIRDNAVLFFNLP